ncbi:HNH endonuclease [Terrisporobacter muris]|nr:HNH endonuclease [Terrisporobacter muris]
MVKKYLQQKLIIYCGRIHKKEFICPMKPKNNKYKTSEADKFRWTRSWQKKRDDIRRRDKHLCQICIRKLYNTINKYNYNNLEVHHIVPIKESYDLRLEDTNLITLCEYHHELAEQGTIPRDELLSIVKAQEEAENI